MYLGSNLCNVRCGGCNKTIPHDIRCAKINTGGSVSKSFHLRCAEIYFTHQIEEVKTYQKFSGKRIKFKVSY